MSRPRLPKELSWRARALSAALFRETDRAIRRLGWEPARDRSRYIRKAVKALNQEVLNGARRGNGAGSKPP